MPHVSSGWYLTRIDPSRSALADLALNMKTDGSHGLHLFLVGTCGTSLTSLACEKLRGRLRLAVVEERPNGAGGFLDAERWWWITKDDDLNTLGDQRSVRRRGAGTGGHIAWPMLTASTVTARNLYCGSLLDSWLVHPSALYGVLVCIL